VNKELQTGSEQSKVYGMVERKSDAWNISARYKKRDFILKDMLLNASLSHTWDHSLTVDTAYRKYNWDGDYIPSSRSEIAGRARSMRHYKRPLTIVRANLDYELNNRHSFNLNYQLNRTGNDRYDDVDTGFEASNDVVTKHILGLSYNQSVFNGKMKNFFFIKDYINRPNIRQTDIPSVTGSRDVQGSTTQNYFSYGAGLRYTIVEPLSLKASYEHSVRLPLAHELLGDGSTIYANVALKPEISNNINLGVFGTWYPASGHTLYYEAGGFLRNVDNYIQRSPYLKEGTMQYGNVPAVHIKGAEGEVRYDWQNKLQLSANISYQDARNQKKYKSDGKPSATYNNRIPNRPWLFGNAEAGYTFRNIVLPESKLRLGCTYQWVHWHFLTWEAYGTLETKARIPTEHICNADVAYSWKDGRYNIAIECSNFLDKLAYDNYKLQRPGRAFFAKFRLFIN
jgi:outer membrane receptor protein involved in Fe transport